MPNPVRYVRRFPHRMKIAASNTWEELTLEVVFLSVATLALKNLLDAALNLSENMRRAGQWLRENYNQLMEDVEA